MCSKTSQEDWGISIFKADSLVHYFLTRTYCRGEMFIAISSLMLIDNVFGSFTEDQVFCKQSIFTI